MARRSNHAIRNLQSAGWTAAKFTGRTTEKASVNLFRWATTDHYGTAKALDYMPQLGFIEGIKHLIVHFLIMILGAVLSAVWITALIVFGIPLLLTGHF